MGRELPRPKSVAFGGVRLCLLLLVGWGPAAARDAAGPGDFNADGIVDEADFSLLKEAQGGDDPTYDLDGNGVVDLQDVFIFAELFEGSSGTGDEDEEPVLPYQVLVTRFAAAVSLPDFSVIVQPTEPFGITSLRLHGQPVDFVSPRLSMGDWEWFWFQPSGTSPDKLEIKLLTSHWGSPILVREREYVELRYKRRNTLRSGVDVEVRYRFWATEPRFEVEYRITNDSGYPLHAPYVMVGFPGFSDHRWVTEVADAYRERRPWGGHDNFLSEALARRLAEYLMLRHDVTGGVMEGLTTRVAMSVGKDTYALNGYFLATPDLAQVYSAHTNKPGYLTSHLYATFEALPPRQSRTVTIAYELGRE